LPKGREPRPPERLELEQHLTPKTQQAYYERCLTAMEMLAKRIDAWKPDAIVVIGDDQNENIKDDNKPPICIYIGPEMDASLGSVESTQARTGTTHPLLHRGVACGWGKRWSRRSTVSRATRVW
jgi:hypothetical protein